ncbi:MAG TPA: HAMP domain-containing protein [Candidatus Binataceae bacterium]|nr:HAMP domain-containing protein [Candidatus Binataceae bacterium]
MGLRAKFAAVFLLLLVAPIIAVTALELDRTIAVMVEDLGDSAALLIDLTFEQVRAATAGGGQHVITAIGDSSSMRAFIESAQAFGKGVVYLRIEKLDGTIIAGGPIGASGFVGAPPPLDDLQAIANGWWPLAAIRELWAARNYELDRVVQSNGKPIAIIAVGVSTSLIAPELHRALRQILIVAGCALALSLLGALFFGVLVLRPLAAITSGVEQMTVGDDDVRVPVAGADELGVLAAKFNQLSEKVRLNHAQWEAERGQLVNVFHSISDAVLVLDMSATVLFANAEAEGRLGLPAGGIADGKPLARLLGADNPLVRIVETARNAGQGVHDVPITMGDDARRVHFLVTVLALGLAPPAPGMLVILRDLEPVRGLRNVVDHSDRLMSLGEVISDVARQIRNPLSAISSELDLLRRDAELGKPVGERVHAVRDEIGRLDKAVEALNPFMELQASGSSGKRTA